MPPSSLPQPHTWVMAGTRGRDRVTTWLPVDTSLSAQWAVSRRIEVDGIACWDRVADAQILPLPRLVQCSKGDSLRLCIEVAELN